MHIELEVLRVPTLQSEGPEQDVERRFRELLERPEGPAAGWLPGRIVVTPVKVLIGESEVLITLPPAEAIMAIMGGDDLACEGVTAITTSSLWLHFNSSAGCFELDVAQELAEELLENQSEDETVRLVVGFPKVDLRVATLPPTSWTGKLRAGDLQKLSPT